MPCQGASGHVSRGVVPVLPPVVGHVADVGCLELAVGLDLLVMMTGLVGK